MSSSEQVRFGSRTVDAAQKPALVGDVFRRVARRYDLMNDLMSAMGHRLWRHYLMDLIDPQRDHRLIDVAGGNGDIAARFLAAGGGSALVCDPSWPMMQMGRDDLLNRGTAGLRWCGASAEALPVAENCFERYTIVFGLRNTTDPRSAIREAHRVLVAQGQFWCMEFSQPTNPALKKVYYHYLRRVLPFLGSLVLDDAQPYAYLAESIKGFWDREAVAAMLEDAGFTDIRVRSILDGVVAIHSGVKS